MKKLVRLAFAAAVVAALASALAIAVHQPTSHANRLHLTFTETAASITNRVTDSASTS